MHYLKRQFYYLLLVIWGAICLGDPFVQLNFEQMKAVQHGEGPLLILAGAGSGKTRVITHRILHLIQERKVQPWNILAVTFTNKAAEEMKNRVQALLGKKTELWISTFHSSCVKMLRKSAEKLGFTKDFVIYDDADQIDMVKDCLEELQIQERAFQPRGVLSRIDHWKNQLIGPDKAIGLSADYLERRRAEIYQMYQQKLRQNNAMDFGDLLMKTVELFEQNPSVLSYYQDLFRYILVDEYQDTNQAQYRLIRLLSAKSGNLCVVGDDDQSIYAWRGADINNILSFEKDFSGAKVIRLEQNYRSTQKILKIASGVASNNLARKEKTLWTENAEGEGATHYVAQDEKDEARYVVSEIERLCREGKRRLSEFAIFYRTNAQSRTFEEELRRLKLPYTIFGGVRFYDRAEVKDTLAYLRLLVNSRDNLSLKRIINTPARGIGKKTVAVLEAFAVQREISLYETLFSLDQVPKLPSAQKESLKKFRKLFEQWEGFLGKEKVAVFAKRVMEESGLVEDLEKQGTVEAEGRLENLQELLNVLEDFQRSHGGTLSEFMEQVALVQETDRYDSSQGAVPLMTLHLSKGLEFPVIFLVGMEEGLFPHSRSLEETEDLEEERRLCYVGITRAKEKIYFTQALKRRLFGGDQFNLPSRFLDEVPSEFLEKAAAEEPARPVRVDSQIFFEEDYSQLLDESSLMKIGMSVRHPAFGLGVVKKKEGRGEQQKVTVYFQDGRVKTLMVKFAGLQVL
ncbi:MAG: DNA helicase PcrA [Deltaproteobacteria bacterium]|nr:DNA helicase PcrA [Deltaproteobacteria bacterium]